MVSNASIFGEEEMLLSKFPSGMKASSCLKKSSIFSLFYSSAFDNLGIASKPSCQNLSDERGQGSMSH